MADSIGIMEGAFFVSRNELLTWINDLLKLNITKIEQLGTGAVYCQILDACYPGEVALYKVNWRARLEWEFVNNFKVLQQAFEKLQIQKNIDVEKLVKAKYQDNLEFAQWMKRYYEIRYGSGENKGYDPIMRRGKVEPDFSFVDKIIPTKNLLNYQNPFYFASDPKISRTKEDLAGMYSTSKKIKLNPGTALTDKSNKENIPPDNYVFKHNQYEKLKYERDSLHEKLKQIERLVMCSNKSDAAILKSVKDYLGLIVDNKGVRPDSGETNEEGAEETIDESKDYVVLIDTESI